MHSVYYLTDIIIKPVHHNPSVSAPLDPHLDVDGLNRVLRRIGNISAM